MVNVFYFFLKSNIFKEKKKEWNIRKSNGFKGRCM